VSRARRLRVDGAPEMFRILQPYDFMPTKYARLAGLGAFGACAGFVALFALVAYISRHTATGGMMETLSVVTWISVGLVVLALIAVHVAIGKELLSLGRGESRGV
jgi:hypothetical protein